MLLATPASCMRVETPVLAAPFPIQLPANMQGKTEEDGLSTWSPCHPRGRDQDRVPGFNLVQSWLLQSFEMSTSRWKSSVSFLSNKYLKC